MTKKHFIEIAAMLKAQLDMADSRGESETIARIARNLAYQFSHMNGAFRFHTFYTACGLSVDGHADWVAVVGDK